GCYAQSPPQSRFAACSSECKPGTQQRWLRLPRYWASRHCSQAMFRRGAPRRSILSWPCVTNEEFLQMNGFLQDIRYAFRQLGKKPGFTAVAVISLAVGIGANTAIFSVVNAVLLKPLTYPDPDRIVQFLLTSPQGSGPGASVTKFNIWKQHTQVFQDVPAYDFGGPGLNLTGGAYPEQIQGIHVTKDYFRLFGAEVATGRTFTTEEDRPNGGHVVVLSNGLWKRRFGGDPGIVGKAISLGNQPYTVVGILASNFATDPPADLWLPFQFDPN